MSLLREGDNERREEFARTMLGKMETHPHFIDPVKLKNHIGMSCLQLRNDFFLKQLEKIGLTESVFFEIPVVWTMTVSIINPHHMLTFGEVLSSCPV